MEQARAVRERLMRAEERALAIEDAIRNTRDAGQRELFARVLAGVREGIARLHQEYGALILDGCGQGGES